MKHAICIQCHKNPEMVNFLVNYFPSENFDFFIHVDKKSSIIESITKKENVFFANRLDVKWGRFSQIMATLSLFDSFDAKHYKYVHLISGEDFVLKNPNDFLEFFNKTNGAEFIQSNPLPESSTWSWGGEDRYLVYYPNCMIHRPTNKFFKFLRVIYREFVMRTGIFKRKKIPVSKFYGGSSWFSITGGLVDWIKEYLSTNNDYLKFFKNTVCGDEIFFSTIVQYSPYKEKIFNNSLRFMNWEGSTNGGPSVLTAKDLINIDEIYVFARKISSVQCMEEIVKTKLRKD